MSLIVPDVYASIESINYTILSSLALNAIFLASSVNTLCLSILNLYYDFNINLLFFMNSLRFSKLYA